MFRWKLGSMISKWLITYLKIGIYWAYNIYNPPTSLLLTSWDILVDDVSAYYQIMYISDVRQVLTLFFVIWIQTLFFQISWESKGPTPPMPRLPPKK